MAGRKLARVQASTLLEVIISMVVIMVVFGIAMMIYTNVVQSSLSVTKMQARASLNKAMLDAENSPGDPEKQVPEGDFRIEETVKSYHGSKGLVEIDLTAYDNNGKKLAELNKVVLSK